MVVQLVTGGRRIIVEGQKVVKSYFVVHGEVRPRKLGAFDLIMCAFGSGATSACVASFASCGP